MVKNPKGKFIKTFPYYIPIREEQKRMIITALIMVMIIFSLSMYLNYYNTCNSINITSCNQGGLIGFYFR